MTRQWFMDDSRAELSPSPSLTVAEEVNPCTGASPCSCSFLPAAGGVESRELVSETMAVLYSQKGMLREHFP